MYLRQLFFLLTLLLAPLYAEEVASPEKYEFESYNDFDFDPPEGYEFDSFTEVGYRALAEPPLKDVPIPEIPYVESIPSTLVAGCVNALSGAFIESGVDLVVPGPKPLCLQKSWSSNERKWHFGHMPLLTLGFSKHLNHIIAVYQDDSGSGLHFQGPRELSSQESLKPKETLHISPKSYKKGLTNCCLGEISGQTNWKNTIIRYVKKKNKRHLLLRHGSFVDRIFSLYRTNGTFNGIKYGKFRLIEERHPDGNGFRYRYYPHHRLSSIQAYNKTQDLHSVFLNVSEQGRIKTWDSLAGKVSYCFDEKRKLIQVLSSQAPPIAYSYDERNRIHEKILPEGRILQIEYYNHGDHKDKVKLLRTPVGREGNLVITHTFTYNEDKEFEYTSVRDAAGNLTHYVHQDHRLLKIFKYNGNTPLSKEEFTWSPQGELLSRTLEEKGVILFQKNFTYDHYGNITQETLTGNLTGKNDTFVKTFVAKEGWNLPFEECDGDLTLRFSYYEKSNLLKSRLTLIEGRIVKREFFTYDDQGFLIQELLDDGSQEDLEDLTHVTERHLKKITPTNSFPYGLPEKVEEFCFDLPSKSYIPLKTTISRYSLEGKKLHEEHYGSGGLLAFTLEWEYDSQGNLLLEKDALGNTIHYKYDLNNNKIQEEKPELSKYFSYDTSNRCIEEKEVWKDGTTLITKNQYNFLNQKDSTIDPQGNETFYMYNVLGHLIEIIHPSLPGISSKCIERFSYDILGNRQSVQDPLGNLTKINTTVRGQPFLIEYPDGSVEKKEYSPKGYLLKEIAKNGVETLYTRDPFGRITNTSIYDPTGTLLKSTSSTYNTFHLLSETDEEGLITRYFYDSAGRKAIEYQDVKRKQLIYDDLGRLAITREWLDQAQAKVTHLTYDALNRIIEEKIEEFNEELFKKELYAYDSSGNCTETTTFTEDGPSISKTTYTPHGKPCLEQDPLGAITETTYNFHFPYKGALVLKVTRIDPLGNQEVSLFDPKGNILQKSRLDASHTLLQEEIYTYDLSHRLLSIEFLNGTSTSWEWDAMGHEISCKEANKKTTFHAYNSFGQKVSTTTPNGSVLFFEYDPLNRLVREKSSDEKIHYIYTYDKKGRLLTAENLITQLATIRSYDDLSRMTSETLETGFQTRYFYDPLDRLTHFILPDGSYIHYTYSGCRLLSVERVKEGKSVYTHRYLHYDLSGTPLHEELIHNLGLLERRMDPLHRPLSIKAPHYEELLTYDAIGNLLSRTINSLPTHFCYDPLYQLIQESSHTYRYDSESNRIEKDGNPISLNALNQVLSENGTSYSYDGNGNLIEKIEKDQKTLYTYDPLNRLIEVRGPNIHATYSYDAFHRRLTKTVNFQEESYLYQQDSEVGAYVNEHLRELRILGQGLAQDIGAAIAIEKEGTFFAPLHDSSGNVVLLLSPSGTHDTYQPTAFGESLSIPKNPWTFSSKRFDTETGFFYFGKRYFSPSLGRWITPDPAGFVDGRNLYTYVHNNPLTYIDPHGEFAFLIPLAINIGLSYAIEYTLPFVTTALEQYAAGSFAAAFLTGAMNGYNLDLSQNVFCGDFNLGLAEKAGMLLGMGLAVNPRKITTSTIDVAKNELMGGVAQKFISKVRQFTWFRNSTARQAASEVTTKTMEKTSKAALEKRIVKGRFPENPDNFFKGYRREKNGNVIYVSDTMRIRHEKHALKPGKIYSPRHHEQHYHVEYKRDPKIVSWRKDNLEKVQPPGYVFGSGTGFFPGEFLPEELFWGL